MEAVTDLLRIFHVEAKVSLSLSFLAIFLVLLYWYSICPFTVLSRCGIKHPKPLPFVGNMLIFRQGFLEPLLDLIKTHGKVCGYYMGRTPVVVIADPDMLRQIMVKEFSRFPNRVVFRSATKPLTDSLLMLKDKAWKRVRSIISPFLSTAKLKVMVPLIDDVTKVLMTNLNACAESGEAFNINRYFSSFSLDAIASVAFGTQMDSQKNPKHPFVKHSRTVLSSTLFRPIILIGVAFPTLLVPLVRLFPNKRRTEATGFFIDSIKKMIKQRDDQPPEQRRRDFLQLMLDARYSKECVSPECSDTVGCADELAHGDQEAQRSTLKQKSDHPRAEESSARRSQGRITDDEIVGQAYVFFLAGHETTSNSLSFTCYLLAINPECQAKVQEEVDDFFTRHDAPDYNNIQELKYLEMVISEVLRIYPPIYRYNRVVEDDCVVNGQLLPKGSSLDIPVSFLHNSPEYWPEPEKFIPERFTPEQSAQRHPFVYLPFGAGPRVCVGMRLAWLEMKMALVNVLRRFNIMACSETQVPLELTSGITLAAKNGIHIKLTKRDVNMEEPHTPEH